VYPEPREKRMSLRYGIAALLVAGGLVTTWSSALPEERPVASDLGQADAGAGGVMRLAAVDGVTLAYEVRGKGEPVIFIHGALIADTFRLLLAEPALADRYQLIVYHRRGYAGSTHPAEPISVSQHAADCRALLRHLGIERAHVVGHSYGGAVALQLALDFPDVVQSLALLEAAFFGGAAAQGYQDALAKVQRRYHEASPEVVVDEFFQPRFGAGYRASLEKALPGGFAQAVADAGTFFDLEIPGLRAWAFGEAELRRIDRPVLAVLGARSNALWPRFGETHRVLLVTLPDAEGFVLPGANHALQLQNPRGMADALAAFLGRHAMASTAR
jgi:pimeloyl-ACP methyl ester carboxylesterase